MSVDIPEIHPDARLFPLMGIEAIEKLADDIREYGLLEPISLVDGKILDGRCRLQACLIANVAPEFVEIDLGPIMPFEYVLSKNLHRRQLTTIQQALLALDVVPYYAEAALARKHSGRGGMSPEQEPERGKTAERVGHVIGISADTVRRMIAIQKKEPEIIELMRRGTFKSVRQASIAAGLVVSYSSPVHKPNTEDKWAETFTPVAIYLRNWLDQELDLEPKEAKARLRQLQLLRQGLQELENKLEKLIA